MGDTGERESRRAFLEAMERSIIASALADIRSVSPAFGSGGWDVRQFPGSVPPLTAMPAVELHVPERAEPVATVQLQPRHQCTWVPVKLLVHPFEHVADVCAECERVNYRRWCFPIIPNYSKPTRKRISRTTRMMTMIVTMFTAVSRLFEDIWNGLVGALHAVIYPAPRRSSRETR